MRRISRGLSFKATLSDDPVDQRHQLSFKQLSFGIRQAKISKDISAAAFDLHFLSFHRSDSYTITPTRRFASARFAFFGILG